VRSWTGFRPERRYQTAPANGQLEGVNRKHRDQALGYRHQASSLVRGGDVACGGCDFDAIQGGREPGYRDAEEDAPECKNQQ